MKKYEDEEVEEVQHIIYTKNKKFSSEGDSMSPGPLLALHLILSVFYLSVTTCSRMKEI